MNKENKIMIHLKKHKESYIMGVGFALWFATLIIIAVLRGYDPVALSVGRFDIAWYAVFILSGIIMAALLTYKEADNVGINRDHLTDAILFGVILSIVGARIYFVIFNPVGGLKEIINIRTGGLAIHGVIISMLIFIPLYCRYRKMNIFSLLDVVAVGFLVGQIVGRWGNFFNQEAHGGPMSMETYNVLSKIIPNFIMKNMEIRGTVYHPTFLYEGIWNFIGLVGLLILRRKRVFKLGDMIGLYLIWYGLGRGILIEPFRTDALKFVVDANPENFFLNMLNRVNVVFSLTLLTGGGIGYIIIKNKIKPDLPYYYDFVLENRAFLEKTEKETKKEKK